MVTFLLGVAILIVGYIVYGALVEKVFQPDDRPTPAVANEDGIDFVPMATWRIFLIQLLNIAGLGPIFGAITGIEFKVIGNLCFKHKLLFGFTLKECSHNHWSIHSRCHKLGSN